MTQIPSKRSVPRATVAIVILAVCAAAACGGNATPGAAPSQTAPPVSKAQAAFCDDLGDVIAIVDRYGRVFTEDKVTVAQLKTSAGELATAQKKVESSASTLADAITAANRSATTGTALATTTTILATKSADDHIQAIRQAQRTLDPLLDGVDPATTVTAAAAELQAAAFGLEQAYVSLFVDAGCLAGDAQAARTTNAYVAALQKDLATLGFYTGAVDGVYGPDTVRAIKALQASAGLPQTGVVDPATETALVQQLAKKGAQQSLNIAALQGALTAAGFYEGPIDGMWTPALESAVKDFQTAQSLPPTGALDPATLAALLHKNQSSTSASTTTTAAVASSTTPTTAAPTGTSTP